MATYNPMYYLDEAANFLKKPVQNVWQNLTAPGNTQGLAYEDQIAALDDRQKLAEQLQAQADQPFNIQSYKGIQAPISGYEGAAKMLSAALAGWEGGGIAGERRAATAAMKKEDAKTLREIGEALAGTPEETVALARTDPTLGQRNLQDIMSMSGSRQATPDELAAALGGNAPPGRAVMKNMVPGDVFKAAQIAVKNPRLANQGLALLVGETQRRAADAKEAQRYETGQDRLDRGEAARLEQQEKDNEYRTERARLDDKIALEEAEARRLAHKDSVALREATAAGPSRAFTVTGQDGKTTNFFGTNAEARALALQGNRVVEGGIVPKAVPTRAADDLMNKASAYDKAKGLKNDFRPEYTNLGVGGFGGDAVLALKKKYGDNDPAVQWWTAYNEKAGQVRNKLYGASLTPNEITEWLKIAVNPNMNGTTIQANLERQRQLEENAMFRSIGSLKGSGYSEESISGATAYPSSEFKFNKPQAVLPDTPVDNSEAGKRARLAAARAKLNPGAQ